MQRISYSLALIFLLATLTEGQKSDLYLFNLSKIANKYEVSHPRLLSSFNVNGYTNQPSFIDAYRLLAAVGPPEDPIATDIYELNLREKRITRLTHTVDREYSPAVNPFARSEISCVVVEVENGDNQRLWSYPSDLSKGGKGIEVQQSGQIGYYCHLDTDWIAIFEVGTPHKLFLYNLQSGERKFISSNIGRALHRDSKGELVYVHKISASHWFLKKVNTNNFIPSVIKKTIPDAEDFVLLKDDSIIMGQQSKLYHLDVAGDQLWREIADLNKLGISKITRLSHNGLNMLALVNDK